MATTPAHDDTSVKAPFTFVLVFFGLFGVIALVIALLVGVGGGDGAPVGTVASGAGTSKTLEVTLADLSITPGEIDVAAGTNLTLHVMNKGAITHNLTVDGGHKTSDLAPGAMEELHIGPVTKSVQPYCSIPGHKAAGMVLKVNVTGDAPAAPTPADAATKSDGVGATIDFNAKPGPDWKPFDPHLAPAPGGTEHEVTFHMSELVREVPPGSRSRAGPSTGRYLGPCCAARSATCSRSRS